MSKKDSSKFDKKVDEKEVDKKPQNNRNNRKPSNNGNKRDNSKSSKPEFKGKGKVNDFSWWFKDQALATSVLSLPNTGITGLPIDYGNEFSFDVPGIMSLHTVHGIPCSIEGDQMNAVNIAATQLFQDITRRNSRPPTTYNKQDLMLYYLAVNEANAFITYCIRAYGAMMYWRFRNKYVPVRLFEAMGLNWKSFRTHEMEFYNFMKEFVTMASSLPVPKAFDFYNRSGYLYSSYYSDGASTKAQIYMNTPALFRTYDAVGDPDGPRLKATMWHTGHSGETLKTLGDIKAMGWAILEPLINDEDIAIMGSDILRAYGVENCFSWDVCPIDYAIEPIPDNYYYLTQVHNADINYFIDPEDDDYVNYFNIFTSQNHLSVIYEPNIKIASSGRPDYKQIWENSTNLVDFKSQDISQEDWFYSTMWKALPYVYDNDDATVVAFWGNPGEDLMRTELICGATIYVGTGDNVVRIWKNMEIKDDTMAERLLKIANIIQFDWHPMFTLFTSSSDHSSLTGIFPIWEMENYSDIPKKNIMNINRAAMYGIWGLSDRHIDASK